MTGTLAQLGLTHADGYAVKNVWTGKDYGVIRLTQPLSQPVHPTGVVLLRCMPNVKV